jgi:ParB family chromosome partitioning protein
MPENNPPIQGPVFLIEVDKISPNPQQPRRDFDETALQELAASMREFGILQPIVVTKLEEVRESGTEVKYILIAGERRWRAAQLIGMERVPAIIKSVNLAKDRLELAIIENVQRENLSPIESARAYARLQDEFGLTQREIASRMGKSREVIANTIRLLSLPTQVQEAISKNQISESQGRLLLTVSDLAQQQKLFEDLLHSSMSVRELRSRIQSFQKPHAPAESIPVVSVVDPEMMSLQRELEGALGAPVRVERSGETGKLIIAFYSPEELRGIVDRLKASTQNDNQPPSPPLSF